MESQTGRSKSGQISALIADVFQLSTDELPRVAWMFLYSLLAVGALIIGRILQDALLLTLPRSRGRDMILTLIAASALCVSAVTYLYSRHAYALRRDQMIIRINAVLATGMLSVYTLLCTVPASMYHLVIYLNYVFTEVMGSLQVILFWTLASELFNPRAARRSFAIIGGGAVLANLLAFVVRPTVSLLGGAHHLMLLIVGMLLLCLFVVRRIGQQNAQALEHLYQQKQHQHSEQRKRSQIRVGADTERIWSNQHLATIALIVIVTFFTSTLANYLFKAVNADTFQQDRDALASFLSTFYGVSGVLACAIQFVLANRVLCHRTHRSLCTTARTRSLPRTNGRTNRNCPGDHPCLDPTTARTQRTKNLTKE